MARDVDTKILYTLAADVVRLVGKKIEETGVIDVLAHPLQEALVKSWEKGAANLIAGRKLNS